MMARMTPPTMPITMAMKVSRIVVLTPLRIDELKRYLPTTSHWSAGLLIAQFTIWTTTTRMMAAETHRHG